MKSNKIYVAATIALVLGIAVFFSGFSMIDFDITRLSTQPPFTAKSFVSSKSINAIYVEDENTEVTVTSSDSQDNKIHIIYSENENIRYEISESDDGTLKLSRSDIRKWYDYMFVIDFEDPSLEIEIPSNYDGEISIKTSNNDIKMENVRAGNIILETSNDDMEIENVKTSKGFTAINFGGSITMSNTTAGEDISISTSNNKAILEEVKGKKIDVKNTNGKIILNSIVSAEEITATTSNDKIQIDSMDFGTAIILKNSNGDVEGKINGNISDYSFDCEASGGESNLPNNFKNEGKKIDIKTSFGDINIEIDN